ncbi:uncharacterized protein F5147DRAFT_408456 [Suillus discolor]|uniref:Uncharacterized protein n=1 Tax=Suillus discolor TaxID=1912936 RepID=A0A9P7EW42_9AGAM|nr:uncharacterized protein F5147DRAFT_408456 [Suillus discolor]KAG2094444.1 hypothetical protein F5147DRAFT_408456 [Suillus discolor]
MVHSCGVPILFWCSSAAIRSRWVHWLKLVGPVASSPSVAADYLPSLPLRSWIGSISCSDSLLVMLRIECSCLMIRFVAPSPICPDFFWCKVRLSW